MNLNLQLKILILNMKTDTEDFYIKYITELILRVTPYSLHSAIILTSLHPHSYQQHLQTKPNPIKRSMMGAPTLHQLKNHLPLIDCGHYFLRDSQNIKISLFNILYLFGQITNIRIMLMIPFEQNKLQQMIKNSLHQFMQSFSDRFLGENFHRERQNIKNSLGLLIFNVGGTNHHFVQNAIASLGDQDQSLQQMVENILSDHRFFLIDDKLTPETIQKISKINSVILGPEARQNYFKLAISNEGQHKQRLDQVISNIKYMSKIFKNVSQRLIHSFQSLLHKQKRKEALQLFQGQLIFPKKLLTSRHRCQSQTNILMRLLNTANEFWWMKKKADSLFADKTNFKSKVNQFIIFYQLMATLTKWKIISECQYLQDSNMYIIGAFVKICSDTFPFIPIVTDVQIQAKSILPSLISILIVNITELLENEVDELFEDKQPQYKLRQILMLLDKCVEEFNELPQHERAIMFFNGLRIKQRINFIHAQYLYIYHKKMEKYYKSKEKVQWTLKCLMKISSLELLFAMRERKSMMLKYLYLQVGTWLRKQKKYQLSLSFYKQAYAYSSYIEGIKLWVKHSVCEKQKINRQKIEESICFLIDLGLEEEPKKILNYCYGELSQQQEIRNIVELQEMLEDKIHEGEHLRNHEEMLKKLGKMNVQLMERERMEELRKFYEEKYLLELC